VMATIVHAYLGPAAAAKELSRAPEPPPSGAERPFAEPFKDLPIRITYRTMLVIDSIARQPGASNRQVADGSEISDQGQVSRLLSRLHRAGLVVNDVPAGSQRVKGERNAWILTDLGAAVRDTLVK
jgi:IclR helix-turn-helix domain